MLILGIVGVVLCALGVVWIGQGSGSLHGSAMTGHPLWTYLGAVLLVVGLAAIVLAYRRGSRKR
jgi:uncharacterized membrane protein YidH (DUF202 family)